MRAGLNIGETPGQLGNVRRTGLLSRSRPAYYRRRRLPVPARLEAFLMQAARWAGLGPKRRWRMRKESSGSQNFRASVGRLQRSSRGSCDAQARGSRRSHHSADRISRYRASPTRHADRTFRPRRHRKCDGTATFHQRAHSSRMPRAGLAQQKLCRHCGCASSIWRNSAYCRRFGRAFCQDGVQYPGRDQTTTITFATMGCCGRRKHGDGY